MIKVLAFITALLKVLGLYQESRRKKNIEGEVLDDVEVKHNERVQRADAADDGVSDPSTSPYRRD